ncbi:hypothetical protein C5167_022171, partial [Papaver somniferum]
EEAGRKPHNTIIELFKLSGVSVASDALPFLGWLDMDGQIEQMQKIAKEVDLIAEKCLEEHRQKRRLQTPTTAATVPRIYHDGNDFMDVLLLVLDEEKGDLFISYNRDTVEKPRVWYVNSILISHTLVTLASLIKWTLLSAGSDTTSMLLTWALSVLLTPNINDLVYLQAIINEKLGLYPAGPLALPHEAIEDCIVDGYKVKAGTQFKPERFLPQVNGGAGGEAAQFTPFRSGRRICPGMNFAIQTLHIVLARLFHAFDFNDESSGLVIDMTEGSGISNHGQSTPLKVQPCPSLPATQY